MKKLIALLLAVLLLCSTLIGCKKEDILGGESTENGKEPNASTQSETLPPKEDVIEHYEQEDVIEHYEQDDSQQGFTIKGKRYYYKGNDVMSQMTVNVYPAGEMLLLNVTNETDTNYTATLKVTYLNESGEIIKTETQTFKQFAAGYQTYFLFRPQNSYTSYTCELSLAEYTGETWVDKLSFKMEKPREDDLWISTLVSQGDHKKYPSIRVDYIWNELPHPELRISRIVIIFDNTGEIYLIRKVGDKLLPALTTPDNNRGRFSLPIYQTTEETLVWPEELTGEVDGIVIYDILD